MGIITRIGRFSGDSARERERQLKRELESERPGRECHVTKRTRDGGRDVECIDKDGTKTFGEAKNWGRVDKGRLKTFADTTDSENAAGVMKAEGFTAPAREEARRRGIELREWSEQSSVLDRLRR